MERDLYYLSYGSNLSVRQMLERCPDAIYVGTAELKGWRLLFKGSQSGSYLTIEKKRGRKVPVLVWKVSELDEKKLDVYEGAPRLYRKEEMEVELHSLADGAPIGTINAFIYIMDESRRTGQPDNWYYLTIYRLVKVCRASASKYTRSKVRKSLPRDFAYIMEEKSKLITKFAT